MPEQNIPKSQFSLAAIGIWLVILAMSFACWRTIQPGLRSEDLVPLAIGGWLLGVGLAMPIIFLQRVCRDSVTFLFGGMLGADVAAAGGLAETAFNRTQYRSTDFGQVSLCSRGTYLPETQRSTLAFTRSAPLRFQNSGVMSAARRVGFGSIYHCHRSNWIRSRPRTRSHVPTPT